MTREEAIAQLKMDRDLCNFNPMTGEEAPMNEDCRKSAEALDMAIKALEQESCKDIMTIHTQGLDEGIRCAMWTTAMNSDRGCDGGGVVNEAMYKEVMNTIRNHIVPSAQPDERMLHESCTDCPLYDKDRHSCPRFNKVIPVTLRELQSAQPYTEAESQNDADDS